MSSKNTITHTGIIKSISPKGITVGIRAQAGCSGCQIKSSCNLADEHEKELDITCNSYPYTTGQQVSVKLESKQGMNAIFLGYVLPFLILLSTMIVLSNISSNEGIIGLVSLASVIPYYIALYIFKDRIKRKFTYVVSPLK